MNNESKVINRRKAISLQSLRIYDEGDSDG